MPENLNCSILDANPIFAVVDTDGQFLSRLAFQGLCVVWLANHLCLQPANANLVDTLLEQIGSNRHGASPTPGLTSIYYLANTRIVPLLFVLFFYKIAHKLHYLRNRSLIESTISTQIKLHAL